MKEKLKRFGAYLIDYLFVIVIASMICEFNVFDKYYENYLEAYETVEKINEDMTTNLNIERIYSEEYMNSYNSLIRNGGYVTIVTTICYLLYFVGFQKWNHNQTLGKKIFGLEVQNKDGGNVSWGSYILRTIINYGLIFNIMVLIISFFFTGKLFINSVLLINLCSYTISYIIMFMIILRKDGRGLHDIIANTLVQEKSK